MTPSTDARRGAKKVIFGGVLLHLTLGTLYSWGCIQPYVASYIRLYHTSVTVSDTTTIYACGTLGQCIVIPMIGSLQFNLGLRGCSALGCLLVSLATLLSSLCTSVGGFAFLNAIFGVGITCAYTCPLVCGYAWMPERKGAVSGFIVAGFGAGAAVFNGVATACVNPNNAIPDPATGFYTEEVAGRVPGMYLVLGTCYLVLGMFGSWMLSPPPEPVLKQVADGALVKHEGQQRSSSRGDYANLDSSESSPRSLEGQQTVSPFHDAYPRVSNQSDFNATNVVALSLVADSPECESGEGQGHPKDHATGERGGEAAIPLCGFEEGKHKRQEITQSNAADESAIAIVESFAVEEARGHFVENSQYQVRDLSDIPLRTVEANRSRSVGIGSFGVAVVEREEQSSPDGVQMVVKAQRQFQTSELFAEWDYYHLALSFMLTAVTGLFIAGNYKHIAEHRYPDDDMFLSVMGSFASLFNASGRIVGGLAVDRFGCFATLLTMASMTTILLFMYGAAQATKPAFFLIICLLHMLYGSNFAIYPTLTAEFFGVSTVGPNYEFVFMAYGLGSFLVMLFLAKVKGSDQVFVVCAMISLMGVASVATHWHRIRGRKQDGPA